MILATWSNAQQQRRLWHLVYPDVPTPNNPIVSKSCTRVVDFLTNNPLGKAYAHLRGGVNKALQDFIVSGPGEASSVLFLMTFAAIMFGCVNAIREIVKEAPIYKRERSVNVGIVPYMFSKIVVLGVLCLLQSLILSYVSAFLILSDTAPFCRRSWRYTSRLYSHRWLVSCWV